jgi:hypothetical protein
MAVGLFNESFNRFLDVLPSSFSENIGFVVAIMKALGILAIVYLIYLIVMIYFSIKKIRELRKIKREIKIIGSKVDILVKKKGIKIPMELKGSKRKKSFWKKVMSRFS